MDSKQRRVFKRMLLRLGGAPKTTVEETSEKPPDHHINWTLCAICVAAVVDIIIALAVPTWRVGALAALFLFAIYPIICVSRWAAEKYHVTRRLEVTVRVATLVTIFLLLGFCAWKSRPVPPLITMQLGPSGLPISVPAHSVGSVLQIHPYIGLTAEKDWLLKIANDTGKEGCWPSPKELDTIRPNGHETVYRVEISNHSRQTLASGKIVLGLKYNKGSPDHLSCMPPSGAERDQEDTVLLPALDPGKSFEFFAVNQSDLCAWLIPPNSATVVIDGDDKETQAKLTFDKSPLYVARAPVFSPTSVTWEGVPSKPGSHYAIMRTGSHPCKEQVR